MKTQQKFFYCLLIVFILLDVILSLKLRSLSTSPTVEIVNHLALPLRVDKQGLLNLLQESGFIQDGATFHLQNEVSYKPKRIVFTFNEMAAGQKGFIQAFYVNDKQVAGYDVSQTADNYQIDFYFSSDYLEGLDGQGLNYAFKSFTTKAILYLAKVHQKKQRVDAADWEEINRLLPQFLKKYDFIRLAKD